MSVPLDERIVGAASHNQPRRLGIDASFAGRLVVDAGPVRYSPAGCPWLILDVRVRDGLRGHPQFVRVSVLGSLAERLGATLNKGDRVRITGQLRLTVSHTPSGEQRAWLAAKARTIEVIRRTRRAEWFGQLPDDANLLDSKQAAQSPELFVIERDATAMFDLDGQDDIVPS